MNPAHPSGGESPPVQQPGAPGAPGATMESIARRLGISVASVSRALNDKPGVSRDTRRRVLELAAQENFNPHGAARSLATDQSNTVALITAARSVPLADDYFYQRVMLGAQQELARQGYFLMVVTLAPDELENLANLRVLRERRTDGLVLAGPEIPARAILDLQARRVPLVLVDNALPHTAVDCVLSEDEVGGYNAASHLLEHGHKRLAMLSGPAAWVSNHKRAHGFRRALAEAGLQPLELHGPETTFASGHAALRAALDQAPETTAIFTANDSMAIGAMRAAREAGRRVPDDLSVVGFDDIEAAAHVDPPLTTVRVSKRQMGATAARRLLELLEQRDVPGSSPISPVRSMVATQLIVRASCGCAA